jgi:O-antigen ligase
MTFFISYNLSESLILEQNDIFWILYVAVVVSLTPPPKRHPRPAMQHTRATAIPAWHGHGVNRDGNSIANLC